MRSGNDMQAELPQERDAAACLLRVKLEQELRVNTGAKWEENGDQGVALGKRQSSNESKD